MFVKETTKTVKIRVQLNPPEWLELAMEGKEDEAIAALRSFTAMSGAQGRSIIRSITDNLITQTTEV